MPFPYDVARNAQAAAGRITVKSALNPFLWLCALMSLSCFVFAIFVGPGHPLMWPLFFVGVSPVILTVAAGGYFALRSPEKLQSEDFQLRQQSLQMIQGAREPEIIDAVTMIANPAAVREVAEVEVLPDTTATAKPEEAR